MACYTIPILTGLIHLYMKKKNPSWKNNINHSRLSLLLFGSSIFGFVDHLWNGELFLFNNLYSDLMLGLTITVSVFIIATGWMFLDKLKTKNESIVSQ